MSFSFRPALRESTAVLIALAGPSGGGKTYSALRLARGLVGPTGKIAGIDTEARRMLHYADEFEFHHCDFQPPFTPERTLESIVAAAKFVGPNGAVVIDSASLEYAGDGGLQDIHTEALEKMADGDAKRMEALSGAAWKTPKMRHKKMMSSLLQLRTHLIFCLRAEPKVKFEKITKIGSNGREYTTTAIIPIGWQPICEKMFMFEMMASFMLSDTEKWLPTPIKLQAQHQHFFPLDKPIGEESGALIAVWSAGKRAVTTTATKSAAVVSPETPKADPVHNGADEHAKEMQVDASDPSGTSPSKVVEDGEPPLNDWETLAGDLKGTLRALATGSSKAFRTYWEVTAKDDRDRLRAGDRKAYEGVVAVMYETNEKIKKAEQL